jgi:hypothetical protein
MLERDSLPIKFRTARVIMLVLFYLIHSPILLKAKYVSSIEVFFDSVNGTFHHSSKPFEVYLLPAEVSSCPACLSEIRVGWGTLPRWCLDSVSLNVLSSDSDSFSHFHGIKFIRWSDSDSFEKYNGHLAIFYHDTLRIISRLGKSDDWTQDFKFIDSVLFETTISAGVISAPEYQITIRNLASMDQLTISAVDPDRLFQIYCRNTGVLYLCNTFGKILNHIKAKDTFDIPNSVFYQTDDDNCFTSDSTAYLCVMKNSNAFDTTMYNITAQAYRDAVISVLKIGKDGTSSIYEINGRRPARLSHDPYSGDVWLSELMETNHPNDTLYQFRPDGTTIRFPGIMGPGSPFLECAANGTFYVIENNDGVEEITHGKPVRHIKFSYIGKRMVIRSLFVNSKGEFILNLYAGHSKTLSVKYDTSGVRITVPEVLPFGKPFFCFQDKVFLVTDLSNNVLSLSEVN